MDRYNGKPLARLVECYVLDAIGQLPDFYRENLKKMEPHLAEVFHTNGTWREIVASAMGLPETLPAKIEKLWERHLDIAMKQGAAVIPDEFAQAFVDHNFPELVSDKDVIK